VLRYVQSGIDRASGKARSEPFQGSPRHRGVDTKDERHVQSPAQRGDQPHQARPSSTAPELGGLRQGGADVELDAKLARRHDDRSAWPHQRDLVLEPALTELFQPIPQRPPSSWRVSPDRRAWPESQRRGRHQRQTRAEGGGGKHQGYRE